jgi:signal transduction histidine kinase
MDKLFEQIENEFSNSMNGTKLIVNNTQNSNKILTNYEALRCVISNLIRNAKEAIDENNNNGTIEMDFYKNKKNNILEIMDTAGGIEEEKLTKIFNPFYTTKENGTGLGLSIVKKIVESLDGNISVESKIGKGTKFKITLPSTNSEILPWLIRK